MLCCYYQCYYHHTTVIMLPGAANPYLIRGKRYKAKGKRQNVKGKRQNVKGKRQEGQGKRQKRLYLVRPFVSSADPSAWSKLKHRPHFCRRKQNAKQKAKTKQQKPNSKKQEAKIKKPNSIRPLSCIPILRGSQRQYCFLPALGARWPMDRCSSPPAFCAVLSP